MSSRKTEWCLREDKRRSRAKQNDTTLEENDSRPSWSCGTRNLAKHSREGGDKQDDASVIRTGHSILSVVLLERGPYCEHVPRGCHVLWREQVLVGEGRVDVAHHHVSTEPVGTARPTTPAASCVREAEPSTCHPALCMYMYVCMWQAAAGGGLTHPEGPPLMRTPVATGTPPASHTTAPPLLRSSHHHEGCTPCPSSSSWVAAAAARPLTHRLPRRGWW